MPGSILMPPLFLRAAVVAAKAAWCACVGRNGRAKQRHRRGRIRFIGPHNGEHLRWSAGGDREVESRGWGGCRAGCGHAWPGVIVGGDHGTGHSTLPSGVVKDRVTAPDTISEQQD